MEFSIPYKTANQMQYLYVYTIFSIWSLWFDIVFDFLFDFSDIELYNCIKE